MIRIRFRIIAVFYQDKLKVTLIQMYIRVVIKGLIDFLINYGGISIALDVKVSSSASHWTGKWRIYRPRLNI